MNPSESQKVAYLELVGYLKRAGTDPVQVMGFLDELHEFADMQKSAAEVTDAAANQQPQQGWWDRTKNFLSQDLDGGLLRRADELLEASVYPEKANELRRRYTLDYAQKNHSTLDSIAKNFFPDDNTRADFYYNLRNPEKGSWAENFVASSANIPPPDRMKALSMAWDAISNNPTVQKYAPPIATALAVGGGSKLLGGSWGTSLGLAGLAGAGHYGLRQGMIPGLEGMASPAAAAAAAAAAAGQAQTSGAAANNATTEMNADLAAANQSAAPAAPAASQTNQPEKPQSAAAPQETTEAQRVQEQNQEHASSINAGANRLTSGRTSGHTPLHTEKKAAGLNEIVSAVKDKAGGAVQNLKERAGAGFLDAAEAGYQANEAPKQLTFKDSLPKSMATGSVIGGIIGLLKTPGTKDEKERLVHRFRNALIGAGVGTLGGAAFSPVVAGSQNYINDVASKSPYEAFGKDRNFIEKLIMLPPEQERSRLANEVPKGWFKGLQKSVIENIPITEQ